MMWQPIETAPKDQFLLLCGPSGHTTIPMVVTTGRMCSDYHTGRWIDHANDDLTDWGFVPTHWMPMLTAPNAQPTPSELVITPKMEQAFYEKVEITTVGSIRGLADGIKAAMLAATPEAKA